jgi:hypothetical protein
MRFLVRAQISTEAGNKMVKNPKFLQDLENYIKKVNAERLISLKQVEIGLLRLLLTLKVLT